MSVDAIIRNPETDESVFIDSVFSVRGSPAQNQQSLSVVDPFKYFGRFKTFVFTSATTNEVLVEPLPGGSLFLTDLLITARSQTSREIEITFTDGTNTEIIFESSLNSQPVRIAIPFSGRWRGWKDARIEVNSDATNRYTIGLGYVKTKNSEEYAIWDSLR